MLTLTNKQYNFLKWFIGIFLPGVSTFYFALTQIFDFSRVPGVLGVISAFTVFLGVITGISSSQYNKTAGAPDGDLVVTQDPESGEKYLGLGVNTSLEAMQAKDKVTLAVVDKTDSRLQLPPQ